MMVFGSIVIRDRICLVRSSIGLRRRNIRCSCGRSRRDWMTLAGESVLIFGLALMVVLVGHVCSGTNSTSNSRVSTQVVRIRSLPAASNLVRMVLVGFFCATAMSFQMFVCIFKACCAAGVDSWVEAIGSIGRVRL